MVVTLDEWASLDVGFVSATEVFDTSSAQGKLMLHLMSAFAEFERIADRGAGEGGSGGGVAAEGSPRSPASGARRGAPA